MAMKRQSRLLGGVMVASLVAFGIVYFVFPGLLFKAYRIWQRSDAGFERRTVQVENWSIPYLDSAPNSDQPVILLLHGFGDTKDNFIDLAAGLTSEYRVVAPDLPGFGETAVRSDAEYTHQLYVTTILGLLNQLDVPSVHLVGYSMGGTLAAKTAARSPSRVRSLTLLAPAGIRGDRLSRLDKMIDAGEDAPLVYRDRESFERVLRLNFNRLPKIPDFVMRAILAEGKRRAVIYERIFEAMLAELEADGFEQEIASLQMPVLLIAGEEDRIVDSSAAQRWQEIHPGIDVEVLPGASHALNHQQGNAVRELLLQHLRSSGGQDLLNDIPVHVR